MTKNTKKLIEIISLKIYLILIKINNCSLLYNYIILLKINNCIIFNFSLDCIWHKYFSPVSFCTHARARARARTHTHTHIETSYTAYILIFSTHNNFPILYYTRWILRVRFITFTSIQELLSYFLTLTSLESCVQY